VLEEGHADLAIVRSDIAMPPSEHSLGQGLFQLVE
jgi:hypothetical protein